VLGQLIVGSTELISAYPASILRYSFTLKTASKLP
jgi:hypothetical protein